MVEIEGQNQQELAQELIKGEQELSAEDAVEQGEARSDSAALAGMEAMQSTFKRFEPSWKNHLGSPLPLPQLTGLGWPGEKVMNWTRSRIFDVLQAGSTQYREELNTNAHRVEDRLKVLKYNRAEEDTLLAVKKMRLNRNVSLGIVNDQIGVMQKTVPLINKELEEREQLGLMVLDQRSWLKKKAGFWKEKRFKAIMKRVRERTENEGQRMLERLEVAKKYAEQSTRLAETRIKSLITTADRQQKEDISQALMGLFEGQNNIGDVRRAFGLNGDRFSDAQILDALEQEGMLDRIRETQESAGLYRNATENLNNVEVREDQFEAQLNGFGFAAFEARLSSMFTVESGDGGVDPKDLAVRISAEFKRNQNIFGSMNRQGMSAPEEILVTGFAALDGLTDDELQHFPRSVMRDILTYLKHQKGKETADIDAEVLDEMNKVTESALNEVKWMLEGNKNGHAAPKGNFAAKGNLLELSKALSKPAGTKTIDALNAAVIEYDRFEVHFDGMKGKYERGKKDLSASERAKMDGLWAQMQQIEQKMKEKVETWKQEMAGYKKLVVQSGDPKTPETKYEADIQTLEGEIKTLDGSIGKHKELETEVKGRKQQGGGQTASTWKKNGKMPPAYHNEVKEREAKKKALESAKSGLADLQAYDFTQPGYFSADVFGIEDLEFDKTDVPAAAVAQRKAVDDVQFRTQIRKQFLERLEKEYLEGLGQNMDRQWNFLQAAPAGTLVHLNYSDITGMMAMPDPNDLKERSNYPPVSNGLPPLTEALRVVRKTDKGVVMEGGGYVVVMTGGSVKDGKPQSNLALFKKQGQVGNNRKTGKMQTVNTPGGMGSSAPVDYLQASSQPNISGIALGLQILS
jgi:hypothetical protein